MRDFVLSRILTRDDNTSSIKDYSCAFTDGRATGCMPIYTHCTSYRFAKALALFQSFCPAESLTSTTACTHAGGCYM
jgi:hypothetical protein